MIKAQATQAVARVPATIAPQAIEVLRRLYAPDALRSVVESAERAEQTMLQIKESIATHYGRLKAERDRNKANADTLESYEWVEETKRATEQIERIARLAYVDEISARQGNILVKTKLLFTNIQKSYDDSTTERRCIGAFAITYNPRYGNTNVKNLLFPSIGNPMWSISTSGSPCFGDWGREVQTYTHNKDIYGFFSMMYPYLTSTLDGSAYTRAHIWRDRRAPALYARRLVAGRYVCAITDIDTNAEYEYDENDEIVDTVEQYRIDRGMRGHILESNRNMVRVEWKQSVSLPDGDDGDGDEGKVWWVEKALLTPISKADYEKSEDTFDISNVRHADIDALDALPDGSTLVDGMAVLGIKR